MSMRDMQDDALDAMFIKASDSVEIPFEEKNWNALEKRMDFVTKVTRLTWITALEGVAIIIGIIAMVSLSGILMNDEYRENKANIRSEAAAPSEVDHHASIRSGKTYDNSKAGAALSEKNHSEQPAVNQPSGIAEKENIPGVALIETEEIKTMEFDASTSEAAEIPVYDFQDLPARGMNALSNPVTPALNKTAAIIYPSKPEKNPFTGRLSLNLTFGPDLSGVRVKGLGTGKLTGLGVEYYFTRHMSLMGGINLVSKKYGVSEGDYSIPDSSFLYYGRTPDNINISCQVVDIPVNLYYSVLSWRRSSISLGAGLSSYLMLSEQYKYSYGANNSRTRTITIRNENQHYFGVMNLSVSYAARIGQRWTCQVEPYYKLPVTDIAAAKVRLFSAGVFVSLKYALK